MNRAYSLLSVKKLDDDERVIEGIATTPSPDRMGDIVKPLGLRFKNPLPLLHQHRADQPVGTVTFEKPTANGVRFKARLPKIAELGPLKDRVDTAWQEVKAGLIRGVSIGFRAIERSFLDEGGIRFIESEVLELSLVTIPANADAQIQTVKSISESELRAASGTKKHGDVAPPGASGKSPKPVNLRPKDAKDMKNLAEQITALEAKRAANAARMEAVLQKSVDDGRSTDQAEQEEFDTLEQETEQVDADLKRLRSLERVKALQAKPVNGATTQEKAAELRGGNVVVLPKKLPPGIAFARVAKCIAEAHLKHRDIEAVARALYPDDGLIAKAAVAAGNTTNSTWAKPLVGEESAVFADFVEFLRPQTILGRFGLNGVPALRTVPFRTPLVGQTSGGSAYWVGEGKAKPLTKFDFERKVLEPLKVANIAVITEELLRDSSPSAEMIVRDQIAAALRERLDVDFISPAKAASAGVSPASVTNGLTPIPSSGNDAAAVRADIQALFASFIAANNAPTAGVWIMAATTALALSLMVNPLGQPEFPAINMNGGTFFGLPVIVSEYVTSDTAGSFAVLANASDIYLADEGGIAIDMSREASLQMDDAPTNASSPVTATSLVSLWQTNSVGFRAERTVNWMRRRASAVALLSGVNWGSA